ncbi:MAG TPA: hypothetical protein VGW38_08880 [Chloroflexota bacterium]|nr:hypothetical protein [Chloroflexota bacterium]
MDSEVKHGTRATLLRLRGRQDAMGLWSRHGRKLTRTVAQVIERSGPEILDAAACVALRDKRARLHLTPELLGMLGNTARPAIGWDGVLDTAERDSKPAAMGRIPGVTVRRSPEAQAREAGVIVPDLLLESAQSRAYIVEVRSPAHGQRLAAIYQGVDTPGAYLFTGDADFLEPLRHTGARVLAESTPFADAQELTEILTAPTHARATVAVAA